MTVLKDYRVFGSNNKMTSGKVREICTVGENYLLLVTTDRISAFDVVLPDPIPHKGEVLNRLSLWWFDKTSHIVKNHVVSSDIHDYPPPFCGDKRLEGRSMLVDRATPLPVECIVRGYITGSGWKEYQHNGSICGIMLPAGLKESERLAEPIFTPTTKAPVGQHDESITMEHAADLIGWDVAEQVREIAVKIYTMAAEEARKKGIIIADTKFEFGIMDGEIILIDEVLTPDSSRFWPMDGYAPGKSQPSFDKQFVRDYLETLDWDKTHPGPELPAEIITRTSDKYIEAYERITGARFHHGDTRL
jgi:phosphoribosylaminoimidazole-succinocarboxamide synthase